MDNQDIKIGPFSKKDKMFGIVDCKEDLFVNHVCGLRKNIFIPIDVIYDQTIHYSI